MNYRLHIGLLLLGCFGARASEVIRVGASQQILAVTQDSGTPFRVGDRVCVVEDRREVECGEVTKANAKAAIVKLDSPSDFVQKGSRIRAESNRSGAGRFSRNAPADALAERRQPVEEPEELLGPPPDASDRPRKTERKPAAKLMNSFQPTDLTDKPDWNLSGGVSAGFTFFYPMIHLERRLSSYAALGLMPIYFRSSAGATTVGAVGGLLTFNYYGNEYFRGFWTQVGAGLYRFSVNNGTVEESATSLGFLGTAGWRGNWELGLNVGVGAGLQYVVNPNFTSAEVKAVNVQPVFILDVGFTF